MYVCSLFVCPSRDFFNRVDTSPLSEKGCNFFPYSWHSLKHMKPSIWQLDCQDLFWRLGSVVTRDRTPTSSTRGGHMWPIYMYTEFWNDIIKKCVHSITWSCILVYWARQDRIYCNDLIFCIFKNEEGRGAVVRIVNKK